MTVAAKLLNWASPWMGRSPRRHAGPAAARRGDQPGGRRAAAPVADGGPGRPGWRGAAAQQPGRQGAQRSGHQRSVRLTQAASVPTISLTAGIGALVLAGLVAGGIVVLLRRWPGEGSPPDR